MIYEKLKKIWHSQWEISSGKLIFILSLYFATVLDLSFWRFVWNIVEINSIAVAVFAFSLPFFIFLTLWMFFNLIYVKYVFKPLAGLLLLVSAAANYAMFTFGIFIDSDMYRNVIETDAQETLALITPISCLWVFVTGVLPLLLLLKTKIKYDHFGRELKKRLFNIVLSLLILAAFAAVSYKEYVSFGRNHNEVRKLINTFNYIYATGRYYQKEARRNREFVILDQAPEFMPAADAPKKLIVLVVGETARAANFSLYGYERETNPLLQKEDLIVFGNVEACGTSTAVSVPCMFSHMTRDDLDVTDAKFTQNVLDIAKLAGYQVLWRENDGGCKGVCDRVPTEDMRATKDEKFCKNGSCFDEILLEGLDDKLKNLESDTLLVLHTMGSHGPTYFERYPDEFKKFRPSCDTADLQNCSQEEIISTYDNTILYTDYVLAQLIGILKKYPQYQTVMLYVSDHGESLGENNIYLHGLPYAIAPDYQTKVPMFMWMSDVYAKYNGVDVGALKEKASKENFSHDNLFHTLLNLTDIKTTVYDQHLDILK